MIPPLTRCRGVNPDCPRKMDCARHLQIFEDDPKRDYPIEDNLCRFSRYGDRPFFRPVQP